MSTVLIKENINARANSQGGSDNLRNSSDGNKKLGTVKNISQPQNPNVYTEDIEEYLRKEISNELGKSIIKPGNILRLANRAFQMQMQGKLQHYQQGQMISKKTNT